MSTAALLTPSIVNPETPAAPQQPHNPNGGPRTEAGKATSSKNATTNGLFAQRDFIRPGEEEDYARSKAEIAEALAPVGPLELNLSGEIHRATWRLRRCGEVEAHMVIGLDDGSGYIPDPMEAASARAEKVQKSVDRARAQSHRLLHKCTAELRKLQTERQYRNELFEAGTDISLLGVCDLRSVRKSIVEQETAIFRSQKAEMEALYATPAMPPVAGASSFCKTDPAPSQTPRNAECPCKSGLKYKRCCGEDAPAVLQEVLHAA